MDSVAQKASTAPAAGAEPDPHAESVEVWAFLCPNPSCGTELIIFPEQTGQWVACPSCGLQLRAPEVLPGKAETLYPQQRPAPRPSAHLSPAEAAWLAFQTGRKTGAAAETPPAPADARVALAREVARAAAHPTETEPGEAATAEPKAARPAAVGPGAARPAAAQAADALNSLARASHPGAATSADATGRPPEPQHPTELRFHDESDPLPVGLPQAVAHFIGILAPECRSIPQLRLAVVDPEVGGSVCGSRFHDESEPLPESTLRDIAPGPLDEPLAEPAVRDRFVLDARPVAPPGRPRRAATTLHPNAPRPTGSAENSRAASPWRPAPAAVSPRVRPARTFPSSLLLLWIIAAVTAAGVGLLAWAVALPDLAAGSILAIGVAILWTFFGPRPGGPLPPDGPSW